MTQLILHHYEASPFSRKVRAVLGYKGLAWRSCETETFPPRPHLDALAGGYRRIPVLQVGADVFCDSNMAVRALDRLFPDRPLTSPGDALSHPVAAWFEPRMLAIFSVMRFRAREDLDGPKPDPEWLKAFRADRAGFMKPLLDVSQRADAAASAAPQLVAVAGWVDAQLARSGGPFLQGATLSHADVSMWHPFQWLKAGSARRDFLSGLSRLWDWVDRIEAIGVGTPSPILPEETLAIARASTPLVPMEIEPLAGDPAPGEIVSIAPTDYGVDHTRGELVSIGPDHVSVRRQAGEAGEVHVHFPRWGFRVERVAG
jgi:glutathione S-transferase